MESRLFPRSIAPRSSNPARVLVWSLATVLSAPAWAPAVAAAATINVTSTADVIANDGKCTLREAIIAANTNHAVDTCPAGSASPTVDKIVLPAGTYTLAIAGIDEDAAATGDLDIAGPTEIDGAGSASTIVSGASLDRVFHVLPGAVVTITKLTIRDGRAVSSAVTPASTGGGVLNDGTLTLSSVIVEDNSADPSTLPTGAALGGGIASRAGSTLTLDTTTVTANVAQPGASSDSIGEGGGIYFVGATLSARASSIASNQAFGGLTGPTPGSPGTPALGGGLYFAGAAGTLTDVTVSGNTAQGQGAVEFGGFGNGSGGGIENAAGSLTIARSSISGNTASAVGGAAAGVGLGGGIHSTASLTVTSSTISGNLATGGAAINNTGTASGGGIMSDGDLSLTNTTVSGNTAQGSTGTFGNGGDANGGGVFATTTAHGISLVNVTIASNVSRGGAGGTIASPSSGGAALGGGWSGHPTFATATGSIIASNGVIGGAAGLGGSTGTASGADCVGTVSTWAISGDLSTGSSCFFTPVTTAQLALGPLASNGGKTQTMALGASSTAIGFALNASCPAADERGYLRSDGHCDAGAFELGATVCTDNDDDGYSVEGGACGPVDCNDQNPNVNPGATEIPGNGIDDDCNPATPATGCAAIEAMGEGGGDASGSASDGALANGLAIALGITLIRRRSKTTP